MEKQIQVLWGKMHDPNDIQELTLTINKEPDSKYYSVARAILQYEGDEAARNMGLPSGVWDLNNIYDEIEARPDMFREGEMIYIHEGLDEKKSVAQVDFYPFGNARLEYFIPASNNNDSSDDDVMSDGFVSGGGKYEVNTNVKVYWRNIDGTYLPYKAKITEINNNEITLTFENPRYIWRGDPNTATDEKGNKLIEKIQREFPPIPKKGGRKSKRKTRKRRRKSRKKKRTRRRKRKTKSLFKKKRTKKRGYGGKSPKRRK